MKLVWVCKHMNKFAQSRAGTVIENMFFSQVRIVQHVYFSTTPNEASVVKPNFFYDYLDRYE